MEKYKKVMLGSKSKQIEKEISDFQLKSAAMRNY